MAAAVSSIQTVKSTAKNVSENVALCSKLTQLVSEFLTANPIPQLVKEVEIAFLLHLIGSHPFVIEAEKVDRLRAFLLCDEDRLLRALVPVAKNFARSPISHYQVGAVGLGASGRIYLGVNLEFPSCPLNASVHGEQFLLTNAREHQETFLTTIAVSAAPCGHCRQFLNEVEGASVIKILFQDHLGNDLTEYSGNLLKASFGPQDLGVKGGLLKLLPRLRSDNSHPLTAAATQAAHNSYSPYTCCPSGIAIQTSDGTTFTGSYMENAAYNPSLSPLQAALVSLVIDHRSYDEISNVVIVEEEGAQIGQAETAEMMVRKLSPKAKFEAVVLRPTSATQTC